MSRRGKDPSKKQDPSKSDSSSDELAEQELELLKIESATDDSPQDSPKPVLSISKDDPLSQPAAAPSGLQESSLESADSKTKRRDLGARPKEPTAGASRHQECSPESTDSKTTSRDLGARRKEPTAGTSRHQESSLESTDSKTKSRDLGARRKEKKKHSSRKPSTMNKSYRQETPSPTLYQNYNPEPSTPTMHENIPQSMSEGDSKSSVAGLTNYSRSNSGKTEKTESTSPVFCQSSTGLSFPNSQEGAVGGVVADHRRMGLLPPVNVLERLGYESDCQGPRIRRAAFGTDSENTSSDVSEIQSEMAEISGDFPREYPTTVGEQSTEASDTSCSTSTSFGKTTSETIGERLTQSFPEDATRRDSGSGIKSEPSPSKDKREKLRESKQTEKDIAEVLRQRAEDEKARIVGSQSCPDLQTSPRFPVPERSYSVGMQRRESDTSEGASNSRRRESDAGDGLSTSLIKTASESMDERLTQSYPEDATRRDSGSGIKSEPCLSKDKREKLRKAKGTDKETDEMLRQRAEDEKAKMVTSQSCPDLPSSSKCPEPKRSCSVGMEHMESLEIEVSSETETSKSEKDPTFKKKGQLRRLQQSTISSGDSFASEDGYSSPLRQGPSVETEDSIPENMDISPEKGGESDAEKVDSETGEVNRVAEQSAEESERSVKKNKRDPRSSSSPKSDDGPDLSPQSGTRRPKKKSKQDEESEPEVPGSLNPDASRSSSEDDTLTLDEHEGRTKL